MDKIIDFNELKNKVNEKDIDNFESYIYSLYYKMAEGKLTMDEFTKEMTAYMENNNISQDKFLKIQTKLMERYGLDTKGFEEQIKALGLDKLTNNPVDYEQARKTMSFQEKYKDRIKVKPITEYYIKNDKNNVVILLDDHNVIIRSEGKVDLVDIELNEFLCSYRKTLNDDKLKIIICDYSKEYDY